MSTLREAAQQALEALENCTSEHGHRCNRCDSEVDEGGQVVTALRAALAQQEQEQEQEKEPVVVYRLGETDIYDFAGWLTTRPGVMRVGTSCEAGPMAEAVGEYLRAFPERFTAHPPRREWQGLTPDAVFASDEIMAANASLGLRIDQLMDLVHAVEQALKEKNQ